MKKFLFHGKKNICGDRIRMARLEKRLSQTDLARLLQLQGVPAERDIISRMEMGDRLVTDYEVVTIRQYLSAQDGPGLRRRMFSGHAVGEGLAIPVFRFAVICLRRCRGGSQTRPLFFGMASFHAERNPSETWREGQAPPLRHNRKNILSQRAGVAYPPVHGPPPSSVVARTARSSSRPSAS